MIANPNIAPIVDKTNAGIHVTTPLASAISIDGFNNDQKHAVIITPDAKPSIELSTFLLIVLKKKPWMRRRL